MDFTYVLYSETRNVAYHHDQPHTNFWSYYLRYQNPKDKWHLLKDNDSHYFDVLPKNVRKGAYRAFNLSQPLGSAEKQLCDEIIRAREKCAIIGLLDFIFVVTKVNRDNSIVLYVGSNIYEAFKAYEENRGAEDVGLYRHGKFVELIFSIPEFIEKYSNLIP